MRADVQFRDIVYVYITAWVQFVVPWAGFARHKTEKDRALEQGEGKRCNRRENQRTWVARDRVKKGLVERDWNNCPADIEAKIVAGTRKGLEVRAQICRVNAVAPSLLDRTLVWESTQNRELTLSRV